MKHNHSVHDSHTHFMALHPSSIGLTGIVLSTAEANIFSSNTHKYDLYHQPDGLMFDPTTKQLYNIEYKCGDAQNKARVQLKECEEVLRWIFPQYNITNLYVHGDYKIDIIK